MTVPLSLSQQTFLARAFEGYPPAVRCEMHKHVADLLRPIPNINPQDVRRAADAALARFGERRVA